MFEAHLTVQPDPSIAAVSRDLGYKHTTIQLDRGKHTLQPMLSLRFESSLGQAKARLDQAIKRLTDQGLECVRAKLEVDLAHPAVVDGSALGSGYYEQHIKLDLPKGPASALLQLARGHGAHLSRNPRRELAGHRWERFVTQRSREGHKSTRARFARLIEALQGAGYFIKRIEQEYVLFDSNEALDQGWL